MTVMSDDPHICWHCHAPLRYSGMRCTACGEANDLPQQCGAHCGHLVCDREADHAGPHRGYDDRIDEAIFWSGADILARLRPHPTRPGHFVMEDDG